VTARVDFAESVAGFENFLAANGYAPTVMWVGRQDVLFAGTKQIFVRVPPTADNEANARADFERGRKQKMGVLFKTLCKMDNVTCCYTWVPRDEEEAQCHLMPPDLKMAVNAEESMFVGRAVRSHFKWLWLKLKHRKHQESGVWFFEG
jgi:hypothetical protein